MELFPLDETTWSGGAKPTDYFQSLGYYRHFVLNLFRTVEVEPDDLQLVRGALASVSAPWRVVVVTEDWCGDSATVLPYVATLFESIGVPVRVLRRSKYPHLDVWYATRGGDHIPVVSLVYAVDDRWREAFRWVERPAVAHERVAAWRADHPEFDDLRARKDEDEVAHKGYFRLYAALMRDMSRWYRGGLWREIAREFAEGVSATVG